MPKPSKRRQNSRVSPSGRGNGVNAKWRDLFKLIPGYDPEDGAGECRFVPSIADGVVAFFHDSLTHIEGQLAGTPLNLSPWQQATMGCAFGWMRPDGTRRYREVFEYVPRKNGKTTKIGGLINLVATCDEEPGAQIYSAAAEREQAALVYRQAKGMVLNRPDVFGDVKIYSTFKSLEYANGAIYKALSADADTKHGFNTHFVVVDELHAQKNGDLVNVLVTSTGSRRQPLVWYITTADYDRESICNEKYDYACKVRDGIIKDPAFLPIIFEALPSDDWTSEATWRKANPNLDVSVSLDYLKRECERAKETPNYENTFKRLHLNIRTQNDVKWLHLERWDQCDDPVNEEELAGRDCTAALDLSTKTDLSAWVLLFPPASEDDKWIIIPRFFAPAENAEKRERRDRVPYMTWAKQGLLTLTDGNVIDYDFIKAKILDDARKFQIRGLAYDPWNATQIALQLQAEGAPVLEFNQGFRSMSEPTKELEKLVLEKRLAHGGNPVLRWMASNTSVENDPAGNIKPSKKKSTERIDGIVATCMALGLAIAHPLEGPSVYEGRGMVTI